MATCVQCIAAIFDLDGTLLDTEFLSQDVIASIAAEHGKQYSWALHKTIIGRPSAEWTLMVVTALELTGVLAPLTLAHEWERRMKARYGEATLTAGSLALLRSLHAKSVPLVRTLGVVMKRMDGFRSSFRSYSLV